MFAIGLTILPCAWLTDIPTAQAIFAMAGRFFATYAMNTGFQFSVEVICAKPDRVTLSSHVLSHILGQPWASSGLWGDSGVHFPSKCAEMRGVLFKFKPLGIH